MGLGACSLSASARTLGVSYRDVTPMSAYAAAHNCGPLFGYSLESTDYLRCGSSLISVSEAHTLGRKYYTPAIYRFMQEGCTLGRLTSTRVTCESGQKYNKADFFPPRDEYSRTRTKSLLASVPNLGSCLLTSVPMTDGLPARPTTQHTPAQTIYSCQSRTDEGSEGFMTTADALLEESVSRAIERNARPQFKYSQAYLEFPALKKLPDAVKAYAFVNGCHIAGFYKLKRDEKVWPEDVRLSARFADDEFDRTDAFYFGCPGRPLVSVDKAVDEAKDYAPRVMNWVRSHSCTNEAGALLSPNEPLVCGGQRVTGSYLQKLLELPTSKVPAMPGYQVRAPGRCTATAGLVAKWQEKLYAFDTVFRCERKTPEGPAVTYLTPADVRTEQVRLLQLERARAR